MAAGNRPEDVAAGVVPASSTVGHLGLSRGRRYLFSAIVALLLAGLVELALRLPGVGSRVPGGDASHGFATSVDPFASDGEWTTLKPGSHRTFNPVRLERTRSPGSIRIVVLGGSSAYGFPYGDAISHPRFLAHRLEALFPGRTVEVANLAGMSYGSHRIGSLLRWVLKLDPDLVVLDTGHNEFVERAAYQRALGGTASLGELRLRLASSRLYGLLSNGMAGLRERIAPPTPEGGVFGLDVARDEARLFTLEEKERVARRFQDRVRRMVAQCRQADTPMLLLTAPSNLRDWKPETLAFVYPLPLDRQHEFLGHLARGIRALDSLRPEEALAELDAAMAIDDRHALTAFERARALEALGRDEDAAAYRRARDLDPVPIRALTAMNDGIREIASDTHTPLADVEAAFADASMRHVPGHDLFVDYCHPNDRGHQLTADVVARAIVDARLLPDLPPDSVARLAAYQPHDETAPPLEQLSAPVLWWLGTAALRQGHTDEARARFELGLSRDPNDRHVLRALTQLYQSRGEPERAQPLAERLAALPNATMDDQVVVAALDLALGRLDESRQRLSELSRTAPPNANVERMLAQVELKAGNGARAREHFEASLRIRPADYRVRKELADACRAQGDRACAVRAYREVLAQVRYMPSVVQALEEMGESAG